MASASTSERPKASPVLEYGIRLFEVWIIALSCVDRAMIDDADSSGSVFIPGLLNHQCECESPAIKQSKRTLRLLPAGGTQRLIGLLVREQSAAPQADNAEWLE
jgi:hypothetical protein